MVDRVTTVEAPRTGGSSARRSLTVLATTVEGTRCALESAKRLTGDLDARVVLLVPDVRSYSIPFNPAGDDRLDIVAEHRTLVASLDLDATVLVCVCRRVTDVVRQMLGRSSLVIVGGHRGTWWPSREQRLVHRLIGEGYPVVFAQVGAREVQARVSVAAA